MNNNVYILASDGELCHWGIKGMRWGVRRYQNPDGTLTKAGRRRAEKDAKKIADAKAREHDQLAKFDRSIDRQDDLSIRTEEFLRTLERRGQSAKVIKEVEKRWANTSLSDITITESVHNGRKYTAVLMGRLEDSAYDGSPRYAVAAGSWSKGSG